MRIARSGDIPAWFMSNAKRKLLSPGALYTLLNRELTSLRSGECGNCRMPLPYPVERPDEVSANWRIGTPPPCAHGCDVVISEIVARYWPLYDLHDPLTAPVAASARPVADPTSP